MAILSQSNRAHARQIFQNKTDERKKTNHNNQIVIHFQANAVETNKFHRREVAVLSDLNISVQIHINKKLSCRNVQVFLKSNRKQKHQLYK